MADVPVRGAEVRGRQKNKDCAAHSLPASLAKGGKAEKEKQCGRVSKVT